jgi:hypothetical protein
LDTPVPYCRNIKSIIFQGLSIKEKRQTSRSSGKHTCFVFGRSRVQVSARRTAILATGFRGFLQSLEGNARIVP